MMAQHESPPNQDANAHAASTQRTDEGHGEATATAGDENDGESPSSRRRLSDTPDNSLSLRHCKIYGTMMGTTSVTINDINDTAQGMIDNFTPINAGDPMAYMGAMSALVAIEHFAMMHNVLIRECKQVAEIPRTQRAIAAGLLVNRIAVEQMEEEDRGPKGYATAIDGGDDAYANPDARTTIRGGAPRMPRLTAGGDSTTADATNVTHTIDETNDQHAAQPPPPLPTQRHHASSITTTDSELQQKVRFADSQFGSDHGPQPGGGDPAALHDSTKTGHELQQ